MKRIILAAIAATSLVAAVALAAQQGHTVSSHHMGSMASHANMEGKQGTWKGEILDAGCYLGHGAMGEKHKECALKCASMGMPLMIMVNDKAVLLTPDHDNQDPYNAIKNWAGSVVEVTGTMSTRGGVSGINVTGSKLAAAQK